ncbi:hypothetical protein PHYBOEH_006115 [Phytophthora boehmeriae]|uniref:Uncharacterized protein n=1 Tax=Phytophthora boehmeriae TaxID=109152 RepID=A0A8T1X7P3_9STRA|nr:hypothetical protein PHYBOEH_006115 [Phytophthora boehmeriae]
MAERQAKIDFGRRELKYRDEDGQKNILPFTCYGVTPLTDAPGEWQATVHLTKSMKLRANTQTVVQVAVDPPEGTTGVFVPKPTSKRHLPLVPIVDSVVQGVVRVAVLNIEGRREK